MKMSAPTRKASGYFKPKSHALSSADQKQAGINMVDLMMWLVIAALLLAAALQGIGYYQSAANVYTLKNDLNNAVTVAHAQAALGDGEIDDDDLDATLTNTEISDGTTLTWGTVSTTASAEEGNDSPGFSLASMSTAAPTAAGSGQAYVLTATNPAYPNVKVVYFLDKTAGYDEGIKVTDPDEVPITEGGSTETTTTPEPTPTESASPEPTPTPSETEAPAVASHLAFTNGTLTTVAGQRVGPVVVELRDDAGNPVVAPAGGKVINLQSISEVWDLYLTHDGARLPKVAASDSNTMQVNVTVPEGSSTLELYYASSQSGDQTLTVRGLDMTPVSQTIKVTTGDAVSIAWGVDGDQELGKPHDAQIRQSFTPEGGLKVSLLDAYGNRIAAERDVTLVATKSDGGEAGSLLGVATVKTVNGVATFTDLSIDYAHPEQGFGGQGIYDISVTSGDLTSDYSQTIYIG